MTELVHHTSFMAHCLAPSQVDLVESRRSSQVGPTAASGIDAHQDVRIFLRFLAVFHLKTAKQCESPRLLKFQNSTLKIDVDWSNDVLLSSNSDMSFLEWPTILHPQCFMQCRT